MAGSKFDEVTTLIAAKCKFFKIYFFQKQVIIITSYFNQEVKLHFTNYFNQEVKLHSSASNNNSLTRRIFKRPEKK